MGTDHRFRRWLELLPTVLLEQPWVYYPNAHPQAWAASRQEGRVQDLCRTLAERVSGETWLEWAGYQNFTTGMGIELEPPRRNSAIVDALRIPARGELGEQTILAARFLCSQAALWPIEMPQVGLLQVWPSVRRLAGVRLQLALAVGASHHDLRVLAPSFLHGGRVKADQLVDLAAGLLVRLVGYGKFYLGPGSLLDPALAAALMDATVEAVWLAGPTDPNRHSGTFAGHLDRLAYRFWHFVDAPLGN